MEITTVKTLQAAQTPAPGSEISVRLSPSMRLILSTSGSASSIVTHNQGLAALGVDRELVYHSTSHPITAEQYAGLLRSPLVLGGAVTGQGLKTSIIPFLDEVERTAREMRAVNTVVNQRGVLHGYNTDAHGLEQALRMHFDLSKIQPANAIIYGNGGVSGVAVHVLRELGIAVTMTGRNPINVGAKMVELGLNHFEGPFDLVINATPISLDAVENAVGLMPVLADARMVFDHSMPEKFGKLNFLERHCLAHDIYFAPGRDMYVPQMLKQWGLFFEGLDGSNGQPYRVTEHQIAVAWGFER